MDRKAVWVWEGSEQTDGMGTDTDLAEELEDMEDIEEMDDNEDDEVKEMRVRERDDDWEEGEAAAWCTAADAANVSI